ncbi:hypothetical protein D3C79_1096290 [compost metagenome]
MMPIATASTPSGMLMTKSHGQLSECRMIPARVGPMVEETATKSAFRPMAVPNLACGTV